MCGGVFKIFGASPPDPLRRTAQIFALFFPSPATVYSFSLSCWSFSLNFGGVFEGRNPKMCTFGVLGLSCETPAAPPDRAAGGSHTTARELQTCTFQGPGASNTKIPRKRPKEREKRIKKVAGDGKKKREILGPHPSGPHPSGPTTSGPPFGAPHPSGPHHDTKNRLAKHWIGQTLDWPNIGLAQIGLAQNWIGQNWIGQNWSNQDGQNGIGQSRSNKDVDGTPSSSMSTSVENL